MLEYAFTLARQPHALDAPVVFILLSFNEAIGAQARSQLLPNVSFNAGRNYNDLTSEGRNVLGQPTTSQTQYWSGSQVLSVRQPLHRPYLTAQLKQAEAQVQDADATLERDEQSLVVRVGESYFDALLAREQVALVLAQKATYTTQLVAAR